MNKAIEHFLTNNYYLLLKIAKKITKGNQLYDELLHEVIIQLYNKECINLNNYEDNTIKYYIVAIMRINWYSKTSPFYYTTKRYIVNANELFDAETEDELYDYEKDQILQMVEQEFAELDFFKKGIFQLYLTLGSINKVTKHTGIPKASITRYVRECKEKIKNNVNQKIYENN